MSSSDSVRALEKLRADHEVDAFDCGKDDLNRFLKRQAWANQQANSAQTYVLAQGPIVVGYYSLAAGSVTHDDATERVRKGLARHPIPIILLARLAVDKNFQGTGIGAALLKDALVRTAGAASAIGARALLVHAKDNDAKSFYEHFNFVASPTDPYHLFLIMKDLESGAPLFPAGTALFNEGAAIGITNAAQGGPAQVVTLRTQPAMSRRAKLYVAWALSNAAPTAGATLSGTLNLGPFVDGVTLANIVAIDSGAGGTGGALGFNIVEAWDIPLAGTKLSQQVVGGVAGDTSIMSVHAIAWKMRVNRLANE